MALGLDNPIIGFAAFSLIKLSGYSLFFYLARRRVPLRMHWAAAGGTRTSIGIAVGTAVGFGAALVTDNPLPLYLIVLPVIRFGEWWVALTIAAASPRPNLVNPSLLGVPASFALDIPALAGFIAVGGIWVC
jgi:hypothetical protein